MFYDNLYANKIVFDEKKLLAPLPPHLSQEVVFQMYHDIIQNTPLFSGLENEVPPPRVRNTKGYSSTYLAMGCANVRAGTQKRRGVFGYPPEH